MRTSPFEADPESEFAFFLAAKLGMTVGELNARMHNAEYVQWAVYYGREAQRRQLAEQQGKVVLGG